VHLTANDTLYRGKGRVIVGRIICRPALDAEVVVRAAEKEECHLAKMAVLATWFLDQSQKKARPRRATSRRRLLFLARGGRGHTVNMPPKYQIHSRRGQRTTDLCAGARPTAIELGEAGLLLEEARASARAASPRRRAEPRAVAFTPR
jgi:hypothetical protein